MFFKYGGRCYLYSFRKGKCSMKFLLWSCTFVEEEIKWLIISEIVFLTPFLIRGKAFPHRGKAFLFKGETFSLGEGKVFSVPGKGQSSANPGCVMAMPSASAMPRP